MKYGAELLKGAFLKARLSLLTQPEMRIGIENPFRE